MAAGCLDFVLPVNKISAQLGILAGNAEQIEQSGYKNFKIERISDLIAMGARRLSLRY